MQDCKKFLFKKLIFRPRWREGEDKVQVKIPSLTNFNPSPKDMLGTVSAEEKNLQNPASF